MEVKKRSLNQITYSMDTHMTFFSRVDTCSRHKTVEAANHGNRAPIDSDMKQSRQKTIEIKCTYTYIHTYIQRGAGSHAFCVLVTLCACVCRWYVFTVGSTTCTLPPWKEKERSFCDLFKKYVTWKTVLCPRGHQ